MLRTKRTSTHACQSAGYLALLALIAVSATSCGTELTDALSGLSLFPDASSISAEVLAACEGVMTEQEILTHIVAARIDRANGVTKAEERLTASRNCSVDALLGSTDVDACTTCKYAILNQVFGY